MEIHQLLQPAPGDDLSGTWCNSDAVISSLMEAASFVTPILEVFFIRTVGEACGGPRDPALVERCRDFMREEATHSRAHAGFNASLVEYLGARPPGLAVLESLLNGTKRYLPLSKRLLIVASLEHFSAVFSKAYLKWETRWYFRSAFARALFAQHAHEELAHRSVVFDLWLSTGATGRTGRLVAVLLSLSAGMFYLSAAMPWILHRKLGGRLRGTLSELAGFVARTRVDAASLAELFLFARGNFHPASLLDEGKTGPVE